MSNYKIQSLPDYFKQYRESVRKPRKFWDKIAYENFVWYQQWSEVLEFDFQEANITWFKDAKLNITKNCLDRHLSSRGDKTAILWEPNDPNEKPRHITYNELYEEVGRMANVLKAQGVKKGDRVIIYLPMIPELAITMLACARMGAIHMVVFAGFSSDALASRINDGEAKVLITSDGSFRGDKTVDLKGIVDRALEKSDEVEKVLVVKRTGSEINMKEDRDIWLEDELKNASTDYVSLIMDGEEPFFLLYTSVSI